MGEVMAAAPWVDQVEAWEAVLWVGHPEAWEAVPWVDQVETWEAVPWAVPVEAWEVVPWAVPVEAWELVPWADPWAGPVEIWETAPWMAQAQVRPKDTRIITDGPGPAKTHIASACGQPGPFNFLGWDVMANLTPSVETVGKEEILWTNPHEYP